MLRYGTPFIYSSIFGAFIGWAVEDSLAGLVVALAWCAMSVPVIWARWRDDQIFNTYQEDIDIPAEPESDLVAANLNQPPRYR